MTLTASTFPVPNGSMGHEPQVHAPVDFGKAFPSGIILNTGFIALEVVFGFFADSLALRSVFAFTPTRAPGASKLEAFRRLRF